MRISSLLLLSSFVLQVAPAADVRQSWNELRSKREALTAFHQEFEISRTFRLGQKTQGSTSSATLDFARGHWRERSISGAGDRIRIFDGDELYQLEEGSSEYVRIKLSRKEELPQPDPYTSTDLDFSKAVERGHGPCGLSNVQHECVTLEISVRPWARNGSNGISRMLGGSRLLVFDTTTGLLISSRTIENLENPRGGYQSDVMYMLKRMAYNGAADEALFRLPASATREVKELPRWNADRIKKQLAGKAAPDLVLTDIQGKAIKLSDLKGKPYSWIFGRPGVDRAGQTVLLWTSSTRSMAAAI